ILTKDKKKNPLPSSSREELSRKATISMGYFYFQWFWLLMSVVSSIVLVFVLKIVVFLWWRPRRIEQHFSKQGIKGPPYHLFIGNLKELVGLTLKASSHPLMPYSHNILPRVLSFYHHWKKIYGTSFLVWFGPTARLTISDPALIREIFILKSDCFEKNESPPLVRKLEGDGLLTLKGEKWAHHRKIMTPTFYVENLKLINERRKVLSASCEVESAEEKPYDLLEHMIRANLKGPNHQTITVHDMVEECKTIFFAGKDTTSNLMTWATILLAMHPQWQELAREEVLRVCGARDIPSKDDLPKLKLLGMILNESLRLYPPAVATIRRTKTDVQLGGLDIPRGIELLVPTVAVHHDSRLWGHDATSFNPARFAQGVAHAAKHPMAFMPFGLGARRCIGQNLAVLQAKLATAMMLQRFSFDLAPSYRHAPAVLMLLYPQYGAPIIFRKL
ncbi:hypothetical protein RJ640_021216, partial [Escallonia rubra]